MKKAIIIGAVLLTGCVGVRFTKYPTPEPNAQLAQQGADAALWQNSSAEAHWLYRQAYEHAMIKLDENLQRIREGVHSNQDTLYIRRPCAVIVDIDETVLDNSPYQVNAIRHGRTFDQEEWRAWTDKASAKASPGALAFLRYAKGEGCEIFYVTNRDVDEKLSTLKNLSALGFPFADDQHLLLMEGTSDKTERRARVASTHRVVLLVGDQLRDFDERFKDRTANYGRDAVDAMSDTLSDYFILLPNPMYGTWRDVIQGKGTDSEKLARMRAWFGSNAY